MSKITVNDTERAVVSVDGRVVSVLGGGRHRLPRRGVGPWRRRPLVRRVDLRRAQLVVAGQEVATADVPGVRITLVVGYRVVDPVAYLDVAVEPLEQVWLAAQLALRDAVAVRAADTLVTERAAVAGAIGERLREAAAGVGVEVLQVELRDVVLPAEVRRAQLDVLTARQQGLAALERARGETAALRALANGAKALADSPQLLQLRTAQVAATSGGTVVLRVGDVELP